MNTGTLQRPTQPDGSIDNSKKNKQYKWTWEQTQEIIQCYYLVSQQRLSSVKSTFAIWRNRNDQTSFTDMTDGY
eukprot:4212279-Ditylum_brightwellii.AAC.1